MDLFDDPYADIVSSHTKQAAPTDDPYADIVSAHRKVAPSGPSAKSQWAQMVQSDGKDYGHGFKEMDVDFNGKPTRIREDGAVWLNGKWTDPQTAGDAGGRPASAPERDGFTSVSALRAKGYKAEVTGNPDIPILKAHGFRDDEIARLLTDKTYVQGQFQGLEDMFGKGSMGGEAQAGVVGRLSQGLTNVAMKGAQLGSRLPGAQLVGGGSPEMADAIARIKAQQIAANKHKGDISILGIDPLEAAGQMLIPVPGAGLGKGGSLLAKLGGAAARGAIGGAMQPQPNVRYDQSGRSNFGPQLAGQVAGGAVVGPVFEGGAAALGKVLAKVRGIKAGNLSPEMQARVDLAKEYGLDLSAGDISQSPAIKGAEDLSSFMAGGMSKYRAAENTKALAAAKAFVADLKAKMKATGFDDLEQIKAASASGGPDKPNADRILAMLDNVGDNPYVVAEASRESKLFGQQLNARAMEKSVLESAAGTGDVVPTKLLETMKRLEADPKTPKPVLDEIARLKGTLESQQVGQPSMLTGKSEPSFSGTDHLGGGQPVSAPQRTVVGPEMSKEQRAFENVWGLKRHFDQMAQPPGAAGFTTPEGKQASKLFGDLKRAAQADLEAHAATTNPELAKNLTKYNEYYKKVLAPNEYGKLARKFNGTEQPEGVINAFVKANEDGSGKWFFDALDSKGRAAVMAHLGQEMTSAGVSGASAVKPSIRTGKVADVFDKYSSKVEGEPAAIPTFFQGEDKAKIEGFAKLMRLVERNGPPEAGTSALGALKLGLSRGAGLAGSLTVIGGPASRWLFTSPAGKRLLLSLAKDPESPGSKLLLQAFYQKANQFGAIGAGEGVAK